MTPDETAGYIRHHLEQAGRTAELFTDEAITQIHQAARGKPRTVNNICTAALIATAGAGKNLVDHASARVLRGAEDADIGGVRDADVGGVLRPRSRVAAGP